MTDAEIYYELRGGLMRFAASLVGAQNAGDLVSEVIVATLRTKSLSSITNPRAYLMRALLNRARSHARREARETRALAQVVPVLVAEHSADAPGNAIVRAVADLPMMQRAAIYLVYWEDMSRTEAARLLGVRPATLRRYLHLARERLSRCIHE